MKVLMIGRAYPEKTTGMFGIFEYEQSKEISNDCEMSYLFCDLRSIKYQKKILHIKHKDKGTLKLYGINFPVGGLPQKILNIIRSKLMIKLLDEYCKDEGRPDIIHVHFPLLTLTDEIIDQIVKIGKNLVITEHWTAVQNMKLTAAQIAKLKRIEEVANVIICVSEELKTSIEKYLLPKKSDKLIVIPNMVNDNFVYIPQKENTDIFTFMFAGRLEKVKRVDMLIDAFEKAFLPSDENVRLLIVGDGSQYKILQDKINEYSDKRILLTGYKSREEIKDYYAICNCYVSASELETFGVPFVEAWTIGRPIICVDDSPIRAYVKHGENGLLFEKNNIEALQEALKKAKENQFAQPEKISQDAQRLFSAKNVKDRIINEYSKLLDVGM